MKKFEIIYYNYVGQSSNRLFVLAKDEDDARRLFSLIKNPADIEEIYEYSEPKFLTEEQLKRMGT